MQLLVILSLLGLVQSLDLGSLLDIDELMVFVKGANNRLSEASDELNDVEIDGKKKYAEIIDKYLVKVPHTDEDDEDYQKLKDLVEKIDEAWNDLRTKDLGADEKNQLAALAETRNDLYQFYVGLLTNNGFLARVATAKAPYSCDYTMPEQYRLRKIHQAVTLSELRAFILAIKSGDDDQKAVAIAILNLEQYILTSKLGFRETDDYLHICDPPEHIRGETFGEFLGFLQGVVANDGHTTAENREGDCSNNCDALDNQRIDRRLALGSRHLHKKKCNGRIFHCMTLGDIVTCEMDEKSDRRFPWVYNKEADRTYGHKEACNGEKEFEMKEYGSIFTTCRNCLCICAEEDSQTESIRTFSLIPQFADIKDNMVVTGVRFQEAGNMFHIQIEQSKMGPLGEIIPGTSKWKKLKSFVYDADTGYFQMREGISYRKLFENIEYKSFNKDSRSVNLDLVRTPLGEVVVGVSLRYSKTDDAVEIQILSWPFDFKTGELKDPVDLESGDVDYDWITWKNSPRKHANYKKKRFWFSLVGLDEPTLAEYNPIFSEPNEMIKIWVTGGSQDMSQHTVPYIDLQEVTYPDQKTPLGGLELTYSRATGYAGFLGLRLQSFDLTSTFKGEMTQEDIDKYTKDFDGVIVREIPVKSM